MQIVEDDHERSFITSSLQKVNDAIKNAEPDLVGFHSQRAALWMLGEKTPHLRHETNNICCARAYGIDYVRSVVLSYVSPQHLHPWPESWSTVAFPTARE
jgi:hypothetical protein